jgi:hypothetical protein
VYEAEDQERGRVPEHAAGDETRVVFGPAVLLEELLSDLGVDRLFVIAVERQVLV